MPCTVIDLYIQNKISDEDFDLHARDCNHCREMNDRFEQAWSLLDENVEIPDKLAGKIIERKKEIRKSRIRTFDFTMITQIAAVLVAGIFLGIQLGKHSDTRLLTTKESRKQQSLIDFKNDHYFTVEEELFY